MFDINQKDNPQVDAGQASSATAPTNQSSAGTGGGLIGGIIGGVTGAIGMFGQKGRWKRSHNANKEYMEIQQKNQMALNQQGADLAYEQWLKTNYPAQVEQLKKAGLNVGMMYEGQGQGGTTNTGSGGGATGGGGAPAPMPMDIGNALAAAKLAAELKLMNAQSENIEADTENKSTDTELKETQIKGNEIANEIQGKSKDDQIDYLKHLMIEKAGQAQQEQAKGSTSQEQANKDLEQTKAEIAYAYAKIKLSENQIKVGDAQIQKMAEDIAIGKFNAETARNTIGVDKVAGTLLQNIINEIYNVIGYDKNNADQQVKDGKN